LVVEVRHDAAREIHVAVGRGEGVDNGRVHDGEAIIAGAVRNGRHLLALLGDVLLKLGVFE
nr:hypothetical protein [Tanacetum cinerariifolium]